MMTKIMNTAKYIASLFFPCVQDTVAVRELQENTRVQRRKKNNKENKCYVYH